MPTLQSRTPLWQSPSLAVEDFACHEAPHRQGVEEASEAHRVVLVRTGAFARALGREPVLADPTQVLFFTRGQAYRITHPIPGGDRCTVITVSAGTVLEIGRRHDAGWPADPDAPFARAHGLTTPSAALLHHALVGSLRRAERDHLAAHELTLELLDEVLGGLGRPGRRHDARPVPEVSRRARELAEAARIILAERYAAPPSLDELARTLGCSPFHLCRSFSRAVGVPLRRYLDRLRLRLAVDRLAGGAPDLTALALDLGYADHSHLTNACRREFGRPPSALRLSRRFWAARRRGPRAASAAGSAVRRSRAAGAPRPGV
jgi:AraC-like DNA-binding protein